MSLANKYPCVLAVNVEIQADSVQILYVVVVVVLAVLLPRAVGSCACDGLSWTSSLSCFSFVCLFVC